MGYVIGNWITSGIYIIVTKYLVPRPGKEYRMYIIMKMFIVYGKIFAFRKFTVSYTLNNCWPKGMWFHHATTA